MAAPTARFKSADGIPLTADYVAPRKGLPAFILLHGVAAGRGEWEPLVAKLTEKGHGSLSLDFRGHGDSGGPRFDTFTTTKSWLKLERDIGAAIGFLNSKGVARSRIGLVGASIGANLAARAAAIEKGLACVALLSPGLEYRGVGVDEPVLALERPMFAAAAPTDRYALETVEYLKHLQPGATFVRAASGHGAQMLADAEFTTRLLAWMDASCRKPAGTAASP